MVHGGGWLVGFESGDFGFHPLVLVVSIGPEHMYWPRSTVKSSSRIGMAIGIPFDLWN